MKKIFVFLILFISHQLLYADVIIDFNNPQSLQIVSIPLKGSETLIIRGHKLQYDNIVHIKGADGSGKSMVLTINTEGNSMAIIPSSASESFDIKIQPANEREIQLKFVNVDENKPVNVAITTEMYAWNASSSEKTIISLSSVVSQGLKEVVKVAEGMGRDINAEWDYRKKTGVIASVNGHQLKW